MVKLNPVAVQRANRYRDVTVATPLFLLSLMDIHRIHCAAWLIPQNLSIPHCVYPVVWTSNPPRIILSNSEIGQFSKNESNFRTKWSRS